MLVTSPLEEKLDPRVKRTRRLLQRAFEDLLAEKGFNALTVQDITERAEVNRATFYAHYADKFALLEETIREAFRAELEKRTLSACHYSADNLRALIETVCEFLAHSNEHCKAGEQHFDSLVEGQVRAQIQALLEMWLEQTPGKHPPKLAATAATWAIYGLAIQWSREKNRLPAADFAAQVFGLFTGIIPPPAAFSGGTAP